MDPNANLKEILELAAIVREGEPAYSDDDCIRLAELVIALDEWIAGSGFLPRRWDKKHK